MRFRLPRFARLPLGVELHAERVAVVVPRVHDGRAVAHETSFVPLPETADGELDDALAQALRAALSGIRSRERRCVLAAPWPEALSRTFKLPPGMRRSEAARAAELEADAIAPWPSSERITALDPIPGRKRELMLSIGRSGTLERLTVVATSAGLEPVAIDTQACAWRRIVPHADALLDAGSSRAALVVFSGPVPTFQLFAPRLIDERVAAQTRLGLIEARRDADVDVHRLAVFASPERYDTLGPLLTSEGYAVEAVRIGDVEAPAWSLAFALSTWALQGRSAA